MSCGRGFRHVHCTFFMLAFVFLFAFVFELALAFAWRWAEIFGFVFELPLPLTGIQTLALFEGGAFASVKRTVSGTGITNTGAIPAEGFQEGKMEGCGRAE